MPTLGKNHKKTWSWYGDNDPYFGVLSVPRFQRTSISEHDKDLFFASGKKYIDFIFDTIKLHLDSNFIPKTALDFGCGVGRLVVPLAQQCHHATGVDVAAGMRSEALKNCREMDINNVTIEQFESIKKQKFDLINSFIVFQHIPSKQGLQIIDQLLGMLNNNGVAALHVIHDIPRWRVLLNTVRRYTWLLNGVLNIVFEKKPFNYPVMQGNIYDIGKIYDICYRHGCLHTYQRFTDHRGIRGLIIFCQKQPQHVW